MDYMKIIEQNPWILNIGYSLLALIIGILLYMYISYILVNKIENNKLKNVSNKKYKTYIRLIKSIIKYVFIIIILLIILKINGINISSMVAGVGIISIILGFAIQDALKDVIKGFDIISDDYYQVGDVIKYDNYIGKVLSIGLKTTKIEDIGTKNKISISNRNIEKVEVLSHMINIDIPLPYELELSKAESTIDYIIDNISKLKDVENVEYRGVNELGASSINYHIKVYSTPVIRNQVRRDALTCIVKCLEDKNISVPYTQIDIHEK